MKKFLTVVLAAAIALCCSSAFAGQVWTDGNGDGLPDGGPFFVAPNTNVTVGVWIDAQSFSWTNFLAFVEYNRGCASFVSAGYIITGGSTFPIDTFSNPNAVGLGGSGFTQGGVDHLGNMVFQIQVPVACCLTPIIDPNNPSYTFCQLGSPGGYMLFSTAGQSCYGQPQPETGACCYLDGSCDIQEAANCTGTYQGNGTVCATANCPQPATGACCFSNFTCTIVTAAQCAAAGGTYNGDNSLCSSCPPPPDPTGACCYPNFTCTPGLTAAECAATGGAYAGDNTTCAACPAEPTGACCFPDFSCAILTAAACAQGGGNYAGDNTDCSACPPQPVFGACCLPDGQGGCVDGATAEQCAAVGGQFFPNTLCSTPNLCITPTESKSWGEIKGLYR